MIRGSGSSYLLDSKSDLNTTGEIYVELRYSDWAFTGDVSARDVLIEAADSLVDRWNDKVRKIWGRGVWLTFTDWVY